MTEIEFNEKIEKKLDGVLNPVLPNSNYIEELQDRLTSKTEVSVEYPNYLLTVLTITSGLMIGVVTIFVLDKIFKTICRKK